MGRVTRFVLLTVIMVASPIFATEVAYPIPGLGTPSTVALQTAATTGNCLEVNTKHALDKMALEIIGTAGVSAGAVQVECASSCGYAGTWAPLGSAVTVVADGTTVVQIVAPVGCLRARISTPVVDGTVTVYFTGITSRR